MHHAAPPRQENDVFRQYKMDFPGARGEKRIRKRHCAIRLRPPATQVVEVRVYTPCVKAMPAATLFKFYKLPLDAPPGEKVLALDR